MLQNQKFKELIKQYINKYSLNLDGCNILVPVMEKEPALLGMIAGSLIIYIMGVLWFIMVFGGTFIAAISMCVVPFIIFDAIKIAAALPVARLVRPVMTYSR